jgi:hypothetical protein
VTQARIFAINPYPRHTPKTAAALNLAALTALESALENLRKRGTLPVRRHA